MRKLYFFSQIILLCGCASLTADEFSKFDTDFVCMRYGKALRNKDPVEANSAKIVIERRGIAVDVSKNTRVIDRQIVVGDDFCTMHAAWGLPSSINKTTTSNSNFIQWVYRPYSNAAASYVYTNNGIITAIQN